MANPLATKLSSFVDLSADDKAALDTLCAAPRLFEAGHNLIKEGDRPEVVFLLLEGWAYRYKYMHDGGRQILAYLIPGDVCDLHIFILKEMDHSIGLLSDAKVAAVPKETMLALLHDRPAVARAMYWSALVDEGTLREWLVNLGQRDSFERMAHLFCEMWLRMTQVGLVSGDSFSLPLTQEQLADTIGMTTVHANRVLQRMRAEKLVTFNGKRLTIEDVDRLKRIAGFNPNYLHLARRQ